MLHSKVEWFARDVGLDATSGTSSSDAGAPLADAGGKKENIVDGDSKSSAHDRKKGQGKRYFPPRTGVIFVIDASSAMRVKTEEARQTPFELALSLAVRLMKTDVIANTKKQFGVVLYGTREAKNERNIDHIYVIKEPGRPDAKGLQQIMNIAEAGMASSNASAAFDFNARIGSATLEKTAHFAGEWLECALGFCRTMFEKDMKMKRRDSQTVYLFSNNDKPCQEPTAAYSKLRRRIDDMHIANQSVQLWPMTTKARFDADAVFSKLLPDEGSITSDVVDWNQLDELFVEARKRVIPKRRSARILMQVGHGEGALHIAGNVYIVLKQATTPAVKFVSSETQEPLSATTRRKCKDTGALLTPDQIASCYMYGGERVFFDRAEVEEVKRMQHVCADSTSLQVLCFKDLENLKPWHTYHGSRAPYFFDPTICARLEAAWQSTRSLSR